MRVAAITPRIMVRAFANPARPPSPPDIWVYMGASALAGLHTNSVSRARMTLSTGSASQTTQVSTALNASRSPTRRATFAMRSCEMEKLIMRP